MKKKKIRYKRRKQLPKNYITVDSDVYDKYLAGSPINDFWHRKILDAIYTLLMNEINEGEEFRAEKFRPTAFTAEEIAEVMSFGASYDNDFFESVKKGLDEIYEWDVSHGSNLLGDRAERAVIYNYD